MVNRSALIIAISIGLGGCQHATETMPAVLENSSEETMAAVKDALRETIGRTQFEFGAGDPTMTAEIVVLPPPLSPQEDRSPAKPMVFDLITKNGLCYAIHPDTRSEYELVGVSCRPL